MTKSHSATARELKCTHCNRDMTVGGSHIISAEIPSKPGHFYGLCNCTCVMIMTYLDGKLTSVVRTPTVSNEETNRMIAEAADLFAKNGNRQGVFSYEKTGPRQNISDLSKKKQPTSSTKQDNPSHEGQKSLTLIQKIRNFFSKVFKQ